MIVADATLAFHLNLTAKYIVQAVFLVWGCLLYVSFLWAGCKAKALLNSVPSNLLARDISAANQKGRWVLIQIVRSGNYTAGYLL